ncbi:PGAP1-like protein-domain-containing protein [Neohortaea acidophila]|uniref:GPI inositol-deacylase n=1 Tax=Neohortaea acidophila TaxID=245834 RepID=A0A6A6PIE4_9PEZI|nr:PGAP1-like protein-domain-containing protein [Neohortaea acidophila]KAF2479566.1 PGAP1-like protein-domain-containing protein [Neohortaea acidophila]
MAASTKESPRAANTPSGAQQSVKSAADRKTAREPRRSTNHDRRTSWPQTPASPPALAKTPLDPLSQSKENKQNGTEQQRSHMRSAWRCSLLTLATSACSILLLLTIVHSFLHRQQDPKGCAMSYMSPMFTRFTDFDTEHTRFASKYSLYLYREGGVHEDNRLKGIPVLFIPGNAGSYKQMRPIAAEAAHYFHDVLRHDAAALHNGKRPLDFFTVDFHEELTAFHGQTLLDQAEYLNEAIAYILALYLNSDRSLREPGLPEPKSVIILGHSMGGVVARTMLHMPNYQLNTINTIITLSAPHARAPISFDADMVSTYHEINTFWRDSFSAISPARNPLADVTLVSVAGGGLDTMIPSEYSSITSLVPDTHGFTVFTSSIPNVWTGMDHLAIMWCDQFRKALVKALFDVVDVRRPAQTGAQPDRVAALRRRLLTGMERVVDQTALHQDPTLFLTLEHSFTTMMAHGERLQLRSIGEAGLTRAHVMPVPSQLSAEGGKFTLLTDQTLGVGNDDAPISVFLCSVSPPPSGASILTFAMNHDTEGGGVGSTRLACKNAAADVSLLPASTNESTNAFGPAKPFSYLQYNVADLSDTQFVAVVENASEPLPGWLIAEFTTASDSTITISKGHHQILMNGLRRKLPADRPMMMEVKIPEVHATLFAYRFEIERRQCRHSESFAPLLRQYIQEPYESKYFVNARAGNINVHGISPYMPPPLSGGGASEGLSLQFWTDPACNSTMRISIHVDVLGSAGKLVMRYRAVFAAFPVLVVAIVLRKQFKVYDTTGVFMSFSHSMDQCLRTSLPTIFTALTFLGVAFSKASKGPWTANWLNSATSSTAEHAIDFTTNDLLLGNSDPFFWFLVPLFGLISVGICIAVNYIALTLLHLFAIAYSLIHRWTSRSDDPRKPATTNFASSTTQQRFMTIGVLLLLVSTIIPYQWAYLVLCFVQIITCTRALRTARETQSGHNSNFYNYTHAMLVVMLWILPLNMPVLIVWIHNLAVHWFSPFSTHHNLVCILPYILLVETMSMGNMVPRLTSRARYLTNTLIFGLALYAAIYGVTYAYRLHYLVNALCAWLSLIHLSNGPLSLARLSQYLPGSGNTTKKRP